MTEQTITMEITPKQAMRLLQVLGDSHSLSLQTFVKDLRKAAGDSLPKPTMRFYDVGHNDMGVHCSCSHIRKGWMFANDAETRVICTNCNNKFPVPVNSAEKYPVVSAL